MHPLHAAIDAGDLVAPTLAAPETGDFGGEMAPEQPEMPSEAPEMPEMAAETPEGAME